MPDVQSTVTLGGRSFVIAPLRLGRMKKLRAHLATVMTGKHLPIGQLPDEMLVDAYQAIVVAAASAADPSIGPAILETIENLEYFAGVADLAIASGLVLKLSFEDPDTGEANGPSAPMTSPPASSISMGSTASL